MAQGKQKSHSQGAFYKLKSQGLLFLWLTIKKEKDDISSNFNKF